MTDSSILECSKVHGQIDQAKLYLDVNKGVVFFENRPFCGTSVTFQDSIKIASIDYRQGKKQGYYRKWFSDGLLSFEGYYDNGKQEGRSKTWWKNGQLRSQSNFKQGIPDGEQLSWYRSGQLFKKVHLSNGKEDGLQQAWRENGKLYNNYEAKNGRTFGLKRAGLCYELKEENIQ